MEFDRERVIGEMESQIAYSKFINTSKVVLSVYAVQFCLEHIQFYEQKIKELQNSNEELGKHCTELCREIERLRTIPEQLHREMYEQMIKECKIERKLAVRKMHSEIEARCLKGGIYPAFVKSTIDQTAKEMLGGEK